MPKKTIHFVRILCTWLVWTAVYCAILDIFCCAYLDFSPLSLSDWANRIGDFLNNRWIIQTGKDWFLLCIILAFWPIYFIGWRKVYRFHWSRILPKSFHRNTVLIRPTKTEPVRRNFGPQKLRVQTSAIYSARAIDTQTSTSEPMSGGTVGSVPPMGTNAPVPEQPQRPQYEDAEEVQQMLAQTASVQADFFPHVLLEGKYASFAMSTEKLAIVVRIINQPESTFAVDTEVDINSSDWFYESGIVQTPAKDIIGISQNLQANEPNSVATPVILLMGGQLLNIEETLSYFEKNDIILLRTENVDIDEIPLVMDFMADYFGMKSEGV